MVRFCLIVWVFLTSCGPLSLLQKKLDGDRSTIDPKDVKSGCLQGVLVNGRTGEKLPVRTENGDDGVYVLVRDKFLKAKRTSKRTHLQGEFHLCDIPTDNDFPVFARYTGYSPFEGTINIPSTISSKSSEAEYDVRSTKPNLIANIRIFPTATMAKDMTVLVHHNGQPYAGSQVSLKPTGSAFGPILNGFLTPSATRAAPKTATSDDKGVASFAIADLVHGMVYSYTALPADGGSTARSAAGTKTIGLSTSSGEDPYRLYISLPITDIQLAVVSNSLSNNDFSNEGSVRYQFNRDIEIVPGTLDSQVATLTNATDAAIADNVSGNNASEQIATTINGKELVLTPNFKAAPNISKEPGIMVTMSGVAIRPKEGQRLGQIVNLAPTVSIFGGVPFPGAPTTLAIVSGNNQFGDASSLLPDPLVVNLKDQFGSNMVGQSVSFAVTGGGGSLSAASATTGIDGNAQVLWTLGASGAQSVEATNGALTANFSATIATLQIVSGNNQSAKVTTALANPIVIQLDDDSSNPVANAELTLTASGGTLASGAANGATITATTDASGQVSATWTMPSTGANLTTTVTVGSVTAVVLNAVSQLPTTLVKVNAGTADNQTANVNTAVAVDPITEIRDQNGNPIEGVTLRFQANDNGVINGLSDDENINSNASGQVTTVWTLGDTGATAQTLTVSAPNYIGVLQLVWNATTN